MDGGVTIGLAALAALLFARTKGVTSGETGAPPRGSLGTGPQGVPPGLGLATDFEEVVGAVTEGDPDFFVDNGMGDITAAPPKESTPGARSTVEPASDEYLAQLADHKLRRARLWRDQVYLPASRVRLIDLRQEHLQLAAYFLANALPRRGCAVPQLRKEYGKSFDDIKQAAIAGEVLDDIIGAIEGVVGAGSLAKAGDTIAFSAAGDSWQSIQAKVDAFSQAIASGGGTSPRVALALNAGPTVYDGGAGNATGFYDERTPWEFYKDPIEIDGRMYRARMGVFRPSNYDWMYPWNTPALACDAPLRSRVYQRAYLYRAIDFLAATLLPETDIVEDPTRPDLNAPHGVAQVERPLPYSYLYNSKRGRMRGSIFPPLQDDVQLTPEVFVVAATEVPKVTVKPATERGGTVYVEPQQVPADESAPPTGNAAPSPAPALLLPVPDPVSGTSDNSYVFTIGRTSRKQG